MFSSSPTGGSESMELMYLLSITAAARTIDLCAAYFVPDELSRNALLAAVRRGVRVRVIVPGEHIDSETVRLASPNGARCRQLAPRFPSFRPRCSTARC
jgi:cardiolipin synthase